MSSETAEWLNNNVLVGDTDKRGNAWHFDASLQDVPNHYPGAVPLEDVRARLFSWRALETPLLTRVVVETPEGDVVQQEITDPDRKVIIRSDTHDILGVFKSGYTPHQYDEWLLNNVATILDDDLHVSSAGLLKKGAVAWVEVSVPENITTPEGVEFRPNLLACTSFDGSLATTYKRTVLNTVCDNTMSAALGEKGQQIKIKHSAKSFNRIPEAREALQIVYSIADDFAAQVKALCETTVTDAQWAAFLDEVASVDPQQSKRSVTMAENKRAALANLWRHDERVTPWKNTGWGVVQAVNTYTNHLGIVRGTNRAERNYLGAVTGAFDTLDQDTFSTLQKVLITA